MEISPTGPQNGAVRYSLTLVDAETLTPKQGASSCAVFLVPQGREHEWLFGNPAGQPELCAVQKELSAHISLVAPDNAQAQIPFLTVDNSIGERREVARVQSELSGDMVVEDVPDPEVEAALRAQEKKTAQETKTAVPAAASASPNEAVKADRLGHSCFRRLVFLNSGLVQSEVKLRVAASKKKRAKKGKGKAKPTGAAAAGEPTAAADGTGEADGEPEGKLAASEAKAEAGEAPAQAQAQVQTPAAPRMVVDHSYLPAGYYHSVVASLALLDKLERGVIVGLGGGSLAMFIHKSFPEADITAVELDEKVASVAGTYFGFASDDRLHLHIGDGLDFITQRAAIIAVEQEVKAEALAPAAEDCEAAVAAAPALPAALDLIILDVNASSADDRAAGLSFPPSAFLERKFLAALRNCLSPQGRVIVNFGCRSAVLRESLFADLASVFPLVTEAKVPEDVNTVLCLFASPVTWPQPAADRAKFVAQRVAGLKALRSPAFVWPESLSTSLATLLGPELFTVHAMAKADGQTSKKKGKRRR